MSGEPRQELVDLLREVVGVWASSRRHGRVVTEESGMAADESRRGSAERALSTDVRPADPPADRAATKRDPEPSDLSGAPQSSVTG